MNFQSLIQFIHVLDKQLILVFLYSLLNFIYSKFLIFIIQNINDESLFFINSSIKIKKNNLDLLNEFSDFDNSSDSENSNYSSDSSDSCNTCNSTNSESYESINRFQTLEEYNKHLLLCEYNIILRIFNIQNTLVNILNPSDLQKVPILFNNSDNLIDNKQISNLIDNLIDNTIYNTIDYNIINIVECFLFNIKINNNITDNIDNIDNIDNNIDNIDNNIDNINIDDIYTIKKKIILIYYLTNKLNSNNIHNLFPKYKYLYILYKKNNQSTNKFNYILIDLENNYDLIKNKKLLFNKINL